MGSGSYRFDRFLLDGGERRLLRDGAPVELNGRYLDALLLLVREQGRLVTKQRFHDEVWRGVPVTDEALTQCIKTLRRQLGDDAASPRFIETVPKHGYRFLAPVTESGEPGAAGVGSVVPAGAASWLEAGAAGTAGAAAAGLAGGLLYGLAASEGGGGASALLVLVSVTLMVALVGGAGVAFGIAAARSLRPAQPLWAVAGGAAGGLVVGAAVKLLGTDAFALLLGRAPGDITGAPEGALLGGAVGLGWWLARSGGKRRLALGAMASGAGGIAAVLAGGRLLGGSLSLLAETFPGSRLRLDPIGAWFGESGFGTVSQLVTAGLEGALFGGCLIAAMVFAERRRNA